MGLFAIIDNNTANIEANVSGSATPEDFKRLTVDKLIVTNATASITAGTSFGDQMVASVLIPSQYFFTINPGYQDDPIDFRTLGSTWQDMGALDSAIAAYNEGLPAEDAFAAGNYGWLIGAAGDEHPRAYFYGSTGSEDPEGEAAFYGPKIDFQIKSAIGKEFTASTNQIDLFMPDKFGLKFAGQDGKEHPRL